MSYDPMFLISEDYDEIRDRLGGASTELIPDDVIEKTSYLQKAETLIRALVPLYPTILTANDTSPTQGDMDRLVCLKVATIAQTALLLIPKVQQLVRSQNILDYSYTGYSPQDWDAKVQQLRNEQSNAVNLINESYGAPDYSALFQVNGPTRATVPNIAYTSIELIGTPSDNILP